MNLLNKLAIKNLLLNKKRTISTLIGIILSCSLIVAVSTMVTSFRETLIQKSINDTGYYHIKINDVTEEELRTFRNNRDIENVSYIDEKGYGILENCKNENKPYVKLLSMKKNTFEDLSFKLVEGRFPLNSNEVIISNHIKSNGYVDLKIGDKLNVTIGERVSLDGLKLNSSNQYEENEEKLENTSNYSFTIVGIIERPNYYMEAYSDPGYTIISNNLGDGKKIALITLKNPIRYKKVIPNILGAPSYEKINRNELVKYEDFKINTELLRWEVFALGDSTVLMLYIVSLIVIAIIIFTSVFCIRNSFAIATTEKMKMYGMLASVGATKKQIRKNVIFESLALGIVGIPIGIISGIFAVYVLLGIVNSIAGKYLLGNGDKIITKVTYLPILISVILGFITIYLSALSSARKASKVSPINLLRNSEEIKINNKKLKTPFIISKLFRTGGSLAYKNLKRSNKKYRTTVISIAVSIFVFITMSTFINNMFDYTSNYYQQFDYNVVVNSRIESIDKEIQKVKQCENADEVFAPYVVKDFFKIYDLSKLNESYKEIHILNTDGYFDEKQDKFIKNEKTEHADLKIIGLEDATFKKYLKKLGINGDIGKQGILCDEYKEYNADDKIIKKRIYKYKDGDTIKGKIGDEDFEIKIKSIETIKPYGYEQNEANDGLLVVNLDEYKDLNFEVLTIAVKSNDSDKFVEELEKSDVDNELRIINFDDVAKEENAMKLIVEIFLYGFIIVISLIGVTNIFNTITSNMELRKREFASLKSIGMTKKEFNRMINLETIFYSVKSLIYGIILGLIGTFIIYKAFGIKEETEMYLPIKPIIISIIAVFILVFVIMKYSMFKINKQNTIETIRNENI